MLFCTSIFIWNKVICITIPLCSNKMKSEKQLTKLLKCQLSTMVGVGSISVIKKPSTLEKYRRAVDALTCRGQEMLSFLLIPVEWKDIPGQSAKGLHLLKPLRDAWIAELDELLPQSTFCPHKEKPLSQAWGCFKTKLPDMSEDIDLSLLFCFSPSWQPTCFAVGLQASQVWVLLVLQCYPTVPPELYFLICLLHFTER